MIAFTAAATDNQEVAPGEHYVFNDVMTNIGGGYYAPTSEFICPQNGYYMFTFNLGSQLGEYAHGGFVIDGRNGPI